MKKIVTALALAFLVTGQMYAQDQETEEATASKDVACTMQWDPVCGIDGQTFEARGQVVVIGIHPGHSFSTNLWLSAATSSRP